MKTVSQTKAVLEAIAIALYDTDEDILDQAILLRWNARESRPDSISERQPWDMISNSIQDAYRRRASGALAALTYGMEPGHATVFKFGEESFSLTSLS